MTRETGSIEGGVESRVGAKSEEYDGEQGRDGERMSRDGDMSLSRR